MWASKRDRGTLPLSMSEVDRTPDGNAANAPILNISVSLGRKSPSDDQTDLGVVRASIRFAIATGRLEAT
jgi:hypothetical protein